MWKRSGSRARKDERTGGKVEQSPDGVCACAKMNGEIDVDMRTPPPSVRDTENDLLNESGREWRVRE